MVFKVPSNLNHEFHDSTIEPESTTQDKGRCPSSTNPAFFFREKKQKEKKNQRDKPHLNLSALSLAQVTPEKLMLKQESG